MEKSNKLSDIDKQKMRKRLLYMGIIVSILVLWNGVCDMLYVYSANLSGAEYFSPAILDIILSADGRPHWMVMMAQTAGWLYPIYALSYYHWWIGMRKAGFWLARVPLILMAYAILMIGGIQHAGFAFLSVLEQAKAVVGSTDPLFFDQANTYILEHFFWGDLTALIALSLGPIWMAIGILSGKTMYPRWFVFLSPFCVLCITVGIGYILPAPYAGWVIVPFGTWLMLIPTLASTWWLWKHYDY